MKRCVFLVLICLISFPAFSEFRLQKQDLKEKLQRLEKLKKQNSNQDAGGLYDKSNLGKVDAVTSDYGNPPGLNWFGQFGGSASDASSDIVSDASGNVYITGYFSDEIEIAGTHYYSQGEYDGVVIKMNNSGDVLWVKHFPAQEGKLFYINAIAHVGDKLYITGGYTGSPTIDEEVLGEFAETNPFFSILSIDGTIEFVKGIDTQQLSSEGIKIDADAAGNVYWIADILSSDSSAIFKYSSSGNLLWDQAYNLSFSDLEVVSSNIYFLGMNEGYSETLTGGISINYPYRSDVFMARSDLDGTFSWAKMLEHDYSQGYTSSPVFAVDNSENIYLMGHYYGDIAFENDTLQQIYTYSRFIAKFNLNGSYLWSKNVQIDNNESFVDAQCYDGNVYFIFRNIIQVYNSSGGEVMEKQIIFPARAISVNVLDKINVCGKMNELIRVSNTDLSFNESWNLQTGGSAGIGQVVDMTMDNENNIYTFGSISNDVEYAGREISRGLFLAKQNSYGDVIWMKQFSHELLLYGDIGYQIYLDTTRSHLYITGELNAELIIPGETTLSPIDGGSIFFIKYDTDGNYLLSHQEDFSGEELSLVTDFSGNIIWSGVFEGTITIGGVEMISAGSNDGFVAKYTPEGNFDWAERIGGEDIEYVVFLISDTADNLYITGEAYSVDLDVADNNIQLNDGDGHILFAKIDPTGHCEWVKSFARSPLAYGEICSWPTGIMLDNYGDILLKGWHGDSVYFDDILLVSPYNYYSKFLTKVDPDGSVLWAKSISEEVYGYDYGQFDTDSDGNVYFGLQANDTLHFEDIFVYAPEDKDLVVTKYSKEGDLLWVKAMQANSFNWISSVKINNTGNVMVGGYFNDVMTIDNQVFEAANRYGFLMILGASVYPPTANLYCDQELFCEGDSVEMHAFFTGEAPWQVSYTDGSTNNSLSTIENPHVLKVGSPGYYEITDLTDKNYTGNFFGTGVNLEEQALPVAAFDYELDDLTVYFTNNSNHADAYLWDFGDGSSTVAEHPVHTYPDLGEYQVELIAISNSCENHSNKVSINLSAVNVEDIEELSTISVYPNPSDGILYLNFHDKLLPNLSCAIFSSDGKKIWEKYYKENISPQVERIDLSAFPDGMYMLHFNTRDAQSTKKIIVNRN